MCNYMLSFSASTCGAVKPRVMLNPLSLLKKVHTSGEVFLSQLPVLEVTTSKENPLCVKDPQLGHEIEVDKGETDQEILH